jgi:hypothetical protein
MHHGFFKNGGVWVRMAEPPFTPHKNLLFKGESRKTFDFEKAMDTHPNQVAGWRKLY